jgi:hypothetical protein
MPRIGINAPFSHLSNVVYRHLLIDARRLEQAA